MKTGMWYFDGLLRNTTLISWSYVLSMQINFALPMDGHAKIKGNRLPI
jgi:hypothetical protein